MKRSILIFVILACAWLVFVAVFIGWPAPPETSAWHDSSQVSAVQVFFSRTPDSFNLFTAVFAVTRQSPTAAVESFALSQLIAGPTLPERGRGLFSEWNSLFSGPPIFDVHSRCHQIGAGNRDFDLAQNMRGDTTVQGNVTVHFCRMTQSPGIGVDARVTAEIVATLKQFTSVKGVTILTAQGNCFGDQSGMNVCLK